MLLHPPLQKPDLHRPGLSPIPPDGHAPGLTALSFGGLALVALLVAGCASAPEPPGVGRDGPPGQPPPGLAHVPDAEPRVEPIRTSGGTSKPYTVLGRSYTPITDDRPFRETGLASWYGRGFHAQSTASGEPYDMYAMTAAHKTLPLPSYARVRNPANGREVIVRVNDRGPFHEGRVIDLSYTAALRLDLLRGVAPVEIERITNEDIRTGAWRRDDGTRLASTSAPTSSDGASPVPVPVPAAWSAPVAARIEDRPTPVQSPPQRVLVAQASPEVTDGPGATASDATPPPRFRNMEVTELPSMAPVPRSPVSAPTADPTDMPAPQPTAPVQASAASSAPDAPAPGFWIQLGAFREREGADELQAKAARAQPTLAERLRVFSEGGTHRLQAGPYPSRDAAMAAAAPLRDGLRLSPIVVERR